MADIDRNTHVLTSTRKFSASIWQKLSSLLGSTDWNSVQNGENLNDKYDYM